MSPSTDQREHREFAAEIKFLISTPLAAEIREWARERLAPDPNASGDTGDTYQITSLYFDSPALDVFHRRGSFGRSKYRIRRYGAGPEVFLERKLKTRGLLAKRRSIVSSVELPQLVEPLPRRGWAGWWFQRRLRARALRPVCQISYDRTARVTMTPAGPIRLTVDRDLQAWRTGAMAFNDADPGVPLIGKQCILELKYRRETPRLFKLLIEEFALDVRSISKYRLAVTALGLVEDAAAPARNRSAEAAFELVYA